MTRRRHFDEKTHCNYEIATKVFFDYLLVYINQ